MPPDIDLELCLTPPALPALPALRAGPWPLAQFLSYPRARLPRRLGAYPNPESPFGTSRVFNSASPWGPLPSALSSCLAGSAATCLTSMATAPLTDTLFQRGHARCLRSPPCLPAPPSNTPLLFPQIINTHRWARSGRRNSLAFCLVLSISKMVYLNLC